MALLKGGERGTKRGQTAFSLVEPQTLVKKWSLTLTSPFWINNPSILTITIYIFVQWVNKLWPDIVYAVYPKKETPLMKKLTDKKMQREKNGENLWLDTINGFFWRTQKRSIFHLIVCIPLSSSSLFPNFFCIKGLFMSKQNCILNSKVLNTTEMHLPETPPVILGPN